MNFFKNIGQGFNKGIEKAKNEVAGKTEPREFSYAHIANIINDETISDEKVLLEFKKFTNKALDANDIDTAIGLLIQKRPKIIEILSNFKK